MRRLWWLVFCLGVVAGLYEFSKRLDPREWLVAPGASACPEGLTAEQAAEWAQKSALSAFVFIANQSFEAGSSPKLFTERGWQNFVAAAEAAGLVVGGKTVGRERLGHDYMSLEVASKPTAEPNITSGSSTTITGWYAEGLYRVVPEQARMHGPTYSITMNISCTDQAGDRPLAIDQWIMQSQQD